MAGNGRLARMEMEELAVRMIRMGFRGTIVAQESGLSGVTVRRLRRELVGDERPASSGRLPETSGIVRVRRRLIEAGIFILIYRGISDPAVRRPSIETIMRAFIIYEQVHTSVHEGRRLPGVCLNATDAWVLSRDLHTGWVEVERCRACGISYMSVPDQTLNRCCPFCSLMGAHGNTSATSELYALAPSKTTER